MVGRLVFSQNIQTWHCPIAMLRIHSSSDPKPGGQKHSGHAAVQHHLLRLLFLCIVLTPCRCCAMPEIQYWSTPPFACISDALDFGLGQLFLRLHSLKFTRLSCSTPHLAEVRMVHRRGPTDHHPPLTESRRTAPASGSGRAASGDDIASRVTGS